MNKNRISLTIVILLVLSVLLSACAGGANAQVFSWPGLTIDPEKKIGYVANGPSVYAVDLENGTQKWIFPSEPIKNVSFSAPPGLTTDGQLIAPSYAKDVFSIDPTNGQQKWVNQDATNRFYAGPLILGESIFAANIDQSLYALDLQGKKKWSFESGDALWSPPVTDGKTIYLGGMDHFLYAINPDTGKLVWQTEELGGSITGEPVLGTDGMLYLGNFGSKILAINSTNGKTVWETPVEGWVYSSPLLLDDILYFGTLDGTIYAADALSGKILWDVQTSTDRIREISGMPLILGDKLYIGSSSGNFYMVDRKSGQILACKKIQGKLYGPTQTVNTTELGDLVLISPLGRGPSLIALDPELNIKWIFPPNPETDLSTLISSCGQ